MNAKEQASARPALPWSLDCFQPMGENWTTCTISESGGLYPTVASNVRIEHAKHIKHAVNAYPQLVAALRDPEVVYALGYIAEFSGDGGDHDAKKGKRAAKAKERIESLLRSLGESQP